MGEKYNFQKSTHEKGDKMLIQAIILQGRLYSPEMIKTLEERAVLKATTSLDECADMFISIAKNTSMTGQRIAVGE
jgi:hypothetical protein